MKRFGFILMVLVLIGLAIGIYFYRVIWMPNVPLKLTNNELFIKPDTNFKSLSDQLKKESFIVNQGSFDLVAKLMKYDVGAVRSGKYKIEKAWSNRQLISHLRVGNQKAVNLTFNNLRTVDEFAGRLAQQVYLDSITIINYLKNNSNLSSWNVTPESLMCLFIADTYKVHWDTDAKSLIQKLITSGEEFWKTNGRLSKLKDLAFSKNEVYTLASIVHKETNMNDEKDRIAGVYVNRINRGIPLQADPTIVFALKQFDLKRVLNKHLEVDSPYNTYRNLGLPPGPICMPDKSTIDAVLDYEKHRFLYFCAKPDYSGFHNFARSLSEHNNFANSYHRWLNKQRIR